MLRQSTAEDGSQYARNGKGRPHAAAPDGSFVQRNYGSEERKPASKNSRCAQPGDRASDDECMRAGCQRAYETA